jgi:hypothetical protein
MEIVGIFDPFMKPTATASLSGRHFVCLMVSVAGTDSFFLCRRAKASSIKILSSQQRKAPSCSNLGGLREALSQQVRTAFSAP